MIRPEAERYLRGRLARSVTDPDALIREARNEAYSLHRDHDLRRLLKKLADALVTLYADLDAALAREAALREAMRENVGDAYDLLTQGESPTQRRGPSAQRIYDRSRAALTSSPPTAETEKVER